MNMLTAGLDAVLTRILHVSWQAALLIAIILLVQRIFQRQLSPGWRQALWLVLLVRLFLPWTPPAGFSLYNAPRHAATLARTLNAYGPAQDAQPGPSVPGSSRDSSFAQDDSTSQQMTRLLAGAPWFRVAAIIWLSGALTIMAAMLLQNQWLSGAVAKRRLVTESALLETLEDCKTLMGVNTWIAPIVTPRVQGPALLGVLRPRLLLPEQWCDTTTPIERRHIFLHELAHARRHDVFFGWVWSLLVALHWFNPLMWWARDQIRKDQELACDARVLSILSPGERPSYGQTLLDQFQRFTQLRWSYGAAGMVEHAVNMKRRITMALEYTESSRLGTALAVAALVLTGCMGLTDSQPADTAAITTNGTIIPGRGLEALGVGDKDSVVREKLGPPENAEGNWLAYRKRLGIDFLSSLGTGAVVEMRFNPGFTGKTADGVGIGDPLDNALKASGGALQTVQAGQGDAHGVKMGSDRVLYELQGDGKPRAYKFIDEGKGILYWADADKRLTQIVAFAAKSNRNAATDRDQKFPVTVLVFAAKKGVDLKDPKALLDALHENFPPGVRTHHYRTAKVDGQLTGFICADPPDPLKAVLKDHPELVYLSSQAIVDAKEFAEYQEMSSEDRAKRFAPTASGK